MPRSMITFVITTPGRASDGAVRKNRPSSSAVDSAGDVADGDTITTPFARATFCKIAPVTPEQSAPMMALTLSDVIKRSAAAVAAAASIHVLSARTGVTVAPSSNLPDAVTSAIAISAPAAIIGVMDSNGPVKPRITPIFTSSAATADAAKSADAAVAVSNFFIVFSPKSFVKTLPQNTVHNRKRKGQFANP